MGLIFVLNKNITKQSVRKISIALPEAK